MKYTRDITDWDDMPLVLSVKDVCVLLKISRQTVLKLLKNEDIKAKKTENKWFITKAAIQKYLGD